MLDLVIQPDQEWLDEAVYPVVIDPTVSCIPLSQIQSTSWTYYLDSA